MSHNDCYWGGRGNCPKCGRWCGNILGETSEARGLLKVTGVCKIHGEVDLTEQDWSYDDFAGEDDE